MNDESGGDNASRVEESLKILEILQDHLEELSVNEHNFVTSMIDRVERFGKKTLVSPKQLFWLRDLNSRFL